MNLKAESSIFVGGEADTVIEDITMRNMNIVLCKQGTQPHVFFDELPSIRKVYPHTIPVVYARYVNGLEVTGRVTYCEPYNPTENPISEEEFCENVIVKLHSNVHL